MSRAAEEAAEEARDEYFRVTYRINAIRCGLTYLYGRRELRQYVVARLRRRTYWQYVEGYDSATVPAIVDLFLDNPEWMRWRTEMVPNAIFADIRDRWDVAEMFRSIHPGQ